MSYFKGSSDVYPYLFIDKHNLNIKYYIPVCANEWKSGICNKAMSKNLITLVFVFINYYISYFFR